MNYLKYQYELTENIIILTSFMIAKLVLGDEIHLYRGRMTLYDIKLYCQNSFKSLKSIHNPFVLTLYYIDEDGDRICLSSNLDCEIMEQMAQKPIKKLYIKIEESDNQLQILDPEKDERFKLNDQIKEYFSDEETEKEEQMPCLLERKNYADGIRTVTLSQFKEEDIITNQITFQMSLMEQRIIANMLQYEEDLIKAEVQQFMQISMKNVVNKMIRPSNFSIQQILKPVDRKDRERCNNIQKISNPSHFSGIQTLIDKQIQQIIPQIIKKVVRIVQTKLYFTGIACEKEQRKDKFGKQYHQI